MIWVIAYVLVAMFIIFVALSYNEAKIKDDYTKRSRNIDATFIAILWVPLLCIAIFLSPFWAVSSLAKWFGRNYL